MNNSNVVIYSLLSVLSVKARRGQAFAADPGVTWLLLWNQADPKLISSAHVDNADNPGADEMPAHGRVDLSGENVIPIVDGTDRDLQVRRQRQHRTKLGEIVDAGRENSDPVKNFLIDRRSRRYRKSLADLQPDDGAVEAEGALICILFLATDLFDLASR
jgi:hypothetical protein